MELPKRKQNRLTEYDYSQPGAYFITICTHNKQMLFWENVGASIARPEKPQLSFYGNVVQEAILNIPKIYPTISVDNYVVMPNHIHLLLQIHTDDSGRATPQGGFSCPPGNSPSARPYDRKSSAADERICYQAIGCVCLAKVIP